MQDKTRKMCLQIVEYLADPADHRPVGQFCKEANIDDSVYYYMLKYHGDFIYGEVKNQKEKIMEKLRFRAYKSLESRIMKSDVALKLFFQLAGDLVEKTEINTNFMSPEQKRARIIELANQVITKHNTNKEEKA